jgi:hypothetical protein
MKIFISYSQNDKVLAGELKRQFEAYGIDCFVAHDDIVSGSEWEREIRANLESADYFMPIYTADLIQSYWCQQECGFAVARDKKIICLIPDTNGVDPVGFCSRYQGIKIRSFNIAKTIKRLLIEQGLIEDDNADEIEKRIMLFEHSSSWAEGKRNTDSLLELEASLTKADILRIVDIVLSNDQILYSFAAQPYIKSFFIRHSKIIEKEKLERFLEATK